MTRGRGRTVDCGRAEADVRFAQAGAFAVNAELDPLSADAAQRSVAVSNAVLAGIAAADAICCRTLGVRSASSEHGDAGHLLTETPGSGQDAARHLRRLLAAKHMAQYDDRNPTIAETKQALRNMRALLRIASSFS